MDKKYLLLGALCLGFFTTQAYADTNKPQMIIPGYSYPEQSSTYWNTLQNNNTGIAYTILNQNNGEFTTKDSNYERLFKDNTKKGLKNLAYVHLTYSKRDVKDIKENIKSYLSLYGKENVKGFFLDETDALSSNGRKQLKEVYNYIKSLDSDLFVVANPGTTIPDSAYDYADVFCTFESSADNYINSYRKDISTWESDTKKTDKVMHIIYDTKPSDYDKVMALAQQRHAKYIFITSDGNTSLHKTDDFFDELPVNFTYLQSLSDTNITTPITNNSDKVTENKSNVKTTVVNQVSDTEKAPTDTHEQNSASDTRTNTQSESNVANNTTASNGAPIDNSSVLSIRNNSSLVTKTDNQTPKASSEKERQKAEREKQKAEARKEKERQKAEREKQKAEAREEKERQKAEREKQKAEARKEKERQKAEREKQKAEARKEKERQKSKNTK